jgi:hypothetical protein
MTAVGSSEEISEKIVEILLNKCQIATVALDRNWTSQIISLGVGLGLIYGLGRDLSNKFFADPGHETIIRLILPYINFYFAMRFGQLVSYFSSERNALKRAATLYFSKPSLESTNQEDAKKLLRATTTTISYIDYYYQDNPTYREYIYSLFLPIVVGANHAVSLYLLYTLNISSVTYVMLVLLYLIPHILLYVGFYSANKDSIFKDWSVAGLKDWTPNTVAFKGWLFDNGGRFNYTMLLLTLSIVFAIIFYCLIASNPR